jgi:hypothetical protein
VRKFQSGFPIRRQTQNDNELIYSLFFFGTAASQLTGKAQILNPNSVQTFSSVTAYDYLNPISIQRFDVRKIAVLGPNAYPAVIGGEEVR